MKQLKKFERCSQEVHQHPTARNVHELRKLTRRLRSVREFHKLDKLAEVLGEQRDLDVAVMNAQHFNLSAGKLKRKRIEHRKKTQNYLSKKKRKKLLSAVKNEKAFPDGKETVLKTLHKELVLWKRRKIRKENLHELRKFIKKVRYTFEALNRIIPGLKRLQDSLGRIHDLDVLQKLLGPDLAVLSKEKTMIQKGIKQAKETLSFLHINA